MIGNGIRVVLTLLINEDVFNSVWLFSSYKNAPV